MKKYVFIGLIIILGIGLFNNSKEEIAFYVDDVLYDDISSFEDIILDDSKCDKEVDVSWNNESKSLELSNLNSKESTSDTVSISKSMNRLMLMLVPKNE